MKLPQFSLRDLFWLIVVIALAVKVWDAEYKKMKAIEMWQRAVETHPYPQPPTNP